MPIIKCAPNFVALSDVGYIPYCVAKFHPQDKQIIGFLERAIRREEREVITQILSVDGFFDYHCKLASKFVWH